MAVLTLARPGGDDPATELTAGVALEVVHHLVRDPRVLVRSPADPRTRPLERKAEVAERTDADLVVWVGAGTRDGAPIVSWRADSLRGSWTGAGRILGVSGDLRGVPAEIAGAIRATLPNVDSAARADSAAWPAVADPAAYIRFLRVLGKTSAGGLDEAARAALFDSLPEALRSHPPAAVEVGAALLDLAGRVGGAGPHYDRAGEAIQHA
ncbi:MAG TPA: hypothetical protein VFZ21_23600, partial [Gemmatimonadaceae bacterium]|nr:hypothetical protein [Gemmatimonadaceae bacterium]